MTPTAFRLVPCVNLWSRGASPGLSVAHFRGGYPTPKPLLPNWSPSDVFLRSLDPPVWLNPQDDRDTDYNKDTEPGIAPLWLPFSLFCEPHNCMACIRGDSKVGIHLRGPAHTADLADGEGQEGEEGEWQKRSYLQYPRVKSIVFIWYQFTTKVMWWHFTCRVV